MILAGIYITVVMNLLNSSMFEAEKKLDYLLHKVSKIPKIKAKFTSLIIERPFFNMIRRYRT